MSGGAIAFRRMPGARRFDQSFRETSTFDAFGCCPIQAGSGGDPTPSVSRSFTKTACGRFDLTKPFLSNLYSDYALSTTGCAVFCTCYWALESGFPVRSPPLARRAVGIPYKNFKNQPLMDGKLY